MVDAYATRLAQTARNAEVRSKISWWAMYLGLAGGSMLISLMMLQGRPSPSNLAWLFYGAGIAAIIYNPRYGIYLIAGLTLVGDGYLSTWFPFTQNFSGRSSLLFLSDALIISPLETYIVMTAFIWLGKMAVVRRIRVRSGMLFWPAILFITFITYGLGYGLARGGNLTIALWEARFIYYLVAMLFLVSNLIETRSQTNTLFWVITIALFLKAVSGVWYVATVLGWDTSGVERIAEHAMSIQFNLFFVLLFASWLYRDSFIRRLIMSLMLPIILFSFIANHRRAGFLTFGLAMVLIVLLLYRENRKLFWAIAPSGTVLVLVYLAVFWNNLGPLGLLARAVRSVVAQPTPRDAASNLYRDLENANIMFTIKMVPLTGVGFGQKFFIVYPMADISFFEWWEYITHNSILWIWMKTGAGGFFALLMLVGMALALGGRAIWNMPRGQMRAFALAATLYVFTHFVYAFVDMSWDIRSMILVGMMMGLINSLEVIAARPLPVPARRWPWQPAPLIAQDMPLLPQASGVPNNAGPGPGASDPAPSRRVQGPALRPWL